MEPEDADLELDIELKTLAALSEADLDRIMAETGQEFWDDIERAVVGHLERAADLSDAD